MTRTAVTRRGIPETSHGGTCIQSAVDPATSAMYLLVLAVPAVASAEPFRLLAWNVESNRPESRAVSDPAVIASQLEGFERDPETRSGLVVLSEVEPRTVPLFRAAAAKGYGGNLEAILSASGGYRDCDSLLVLVDTERFHVEETCELHRYAGIAGNMLVAEDGADAGTLRARSPLALRIRDRRGGRMFWLVAVHLARGEESLRKEQSRMLCRWADDRVEPVILAGDCNFDFDFHSRRGNDAWREFVESGVWLWLEPDPLVDTNWSDDRTAPPGERRDRFPDSILDFVWVANEARSWRGVSDVVVRPGDFPDDDTTSDHRPVVAVFTPEP